MLNHAEAVQDAKTLLDKEWIGLVSEARQSGLTYQEIQTFSHQEEAVQEAETALDKEWVELVCEAKQLGLTYQEVQTFFRKVGDGI